MEAHFIVLQKDGKAKKFKLRDGEEVVIGRSAKYCQVVIEDDRCSSEHCRIKLRNAKVLFADLNSKNGIKLNGVKVLKQQLFLNDKLKLGESVIYLNPNRMTDFAKKSLTYTGDKQRLRGDITLELHGVKTSRSNNMDSKPNPYQLDSLASDSNDVKKLISRQKAKYIGNDEKDPPSPIIVQFFDGFIFLLDFFFIFFIIKNLTPSLQKSELSLLDILLDTEYIYYSLSGLTLSLLLHYFLKKILGQSLGNYLSQRLQK